MEEDKVSLEELLGNAIADKIEQMSQFEPGSKEEAILAKDIAVMYDQLTKSAEAGFKIEEVNAKFEFEAKKFEEEMKLKREQFEFEKQKAEEEKAAAKKDRKLDWIFKGVTIGVSVAGIIVPLVCYNGWMNKGLKFEETGSLTSATFRGFWGKIKPTKVD